MLSLFICSPFLSSSIRSLFRRSFNLSGDDGPDKILIVNAAVCHLGVLQYLFGLLLAQGLPEGVHYLLEVSFGDVVVLLLIRQEVPSSKKEKAFSSYYSWLICDCFSANCIPISTNFCIWKKPCLMGSTLFSSSIISSSVGKRRADLMSFAGLGH